jgi:citrate synthase
MSGSDTGTPGQPATGYPTGIGTSDLTTIRLLGQDLAADLLGQVSFGELAFWLVAGERPTPGQARMFDAVLVALADHGFTPTAIAARLTYLSAPDALQGAVAAGLLGGGSRFLGVTEDTGRYLAEILSGIADSTGAGPAATAGRPAGSQELDFDALARAAVTASRDAGRKVPGLGHPVHKNGDPRTPAIMRIAEEEGVLGPHLRLFEAIGRVHPEILGRTLPLNGAGVCGAALADLGFRPEILRGFALLARTAGLLGHLAEEMRQPVAGRIYQSVDRAAHYVPPGSDTPW